MVARIETKLGTYAYYIISMTITCFHDDYILFEKASGNFLSSLLKLANCSTHGGETWHTCIIDDNQIVSGTFL